MLFQNLEKEKQDLFVSPDHPQIRYTGRIDQSDPKTPVLVSVGSSMTFRFKGTKVSLILHNLHNCYRNFLGYCLDGQYQGKVEIQKHEEDIQILIADGLPDKEHEIMIFKCQDACNYVEIKGILFNHSARMLSASKPLRRRMECFGDSVSCGEISEAVDYVKKPDPPQDGEFSNCWYSYVSMAARNLGAELYNCSQGGLSLLDETGWFHGPDYVGLESTYDKLRYNSYLGEVTPWDFQRYQPHVVILAIGQNDSHPDDYMGIDKEKSTHWIKSYKELLKKLQSVYPNAFFVLTTTILEHRSAWDDAIEQVTNEMGDPNIVHFLYSNNGCGTPGHIRIPEAEVMAEELCSFLEQFGERIWQDSSEIC